MTAPTPSGVNNGMTARIREELAKGPASASQLAKRLRVDRRRVLALVCQLSSKTGGVVAIEGSWPRLYALVGTVTHPLPQKPVSRGSGQIAGPIIVGAGSRWWSTRLS